MSNFRSSRAWDDMQVTISAARVPASSAPQWTTYNDLCAQAAREALEIAESLKAEEEAHDGKELA